ncbi:hypothetical protein JCM6882_004445 [Rhodosporidiobolus microsporus]
MHSIFSTLALASLALAPFASARPAPSSTRERRSATPSAKPPTPDYKQDAKIASMIKAMAAAASASAAVKARRALDFEVDVDLQRRDDLGGDTLFTRQTACLDSTANDTTINALFYYGGAGTTVELCPGTKINLQNAIFFTAADQVLTTQGNPTDSTRATITVTGEDQSCAIYAACDACSNVSVQNIQVAGSRDTLGRIFDGIGLLEMGGNTVGQTVKNCKIWEPRGWSALHAIEGYQNQCSGMIIKDNEVGPSGWSPTNGAQFKKRDDAVYAPGAWADGISLACGHSQVTGNTITDCTDGGIVIFGAVGSTVSGNTILAQTRRPLGGINLVDWAPYAGTYEGTVVEGNTLIADTNMIKIGIALGGMSWGSDNRTAARTYGGVVRNNVFKSGSSGYFGYAISVAGHNNANVYGNDASGANFGGEPSVACIPNPMVPKSQAFVYDQWTTPGSQLQNNFVNAPLVFLICQEPGPVVGSGNAPSTGMILSGATISNVSSSSSSSSSTVSSTSTTTSTTTTTTTITTTVAPTTTTTTHAPVATTTTTSAKTRQKWYLAPANPKVAKTTTTTTRASVQTQRTKWYLAPGKRSTSTGSRHIIQDDDVLEKRDSAIGAARATPNAKLVNPFAALEQVARLR